MTDNRSNQIDQLIHDNLAQTVPDEVADQLHERTEEFIAPKQSRHLHPAMIRLAVAAMIMIVAAGIWCTLQVSQSNNVFAQAAQQLRTVKTMSFILTMKTSETNMPLIDLYLMYKYPGFIRLHSGDESYFSISSTAADTYISINNNDKSYWRGPDSGPNDNIDAWFEALVHFPTNYDEDLGEDTIDGAVFHKYHVIHNDQQVYLWLSADGSIHRIEYSSLDQNNEKTIMSIMTDIVINPDLPDSLFSMTPPEGYTYSEGFAM